MKFLQTFTFLCFLITYAVAKCSIQVECPQTQYKNNKKMNCTLDSDNSACPKCVCEDQEPKHECGINEAMNDCAKPKFCNTCEIKGNCKLKMCTKGCDCLEGYYRNSTGVCMPASQCPVTCPVNEEYTDCVIPCNDCETKGDCDFLVCNKGCDCKKDHYRGINGTCIPESQCPIKGTCELEGEEYTDCGSACPLTCDNKDDPPICTQQCVPGCFCRDGMARNKEGRCVEKSKCPPKKPPTKTCDRKKKEQYYECTPVCNNTCDNYGKPGACPDICKSGCSCKKGYVRRNDGKCVKPKQCKAPTKPTNKRHRRRPHHHRRRPHHHRRRPHHHRRRPHSHHRRPNHHHHPKQLSTVPPVQCGIPRCSCRLDYTTKPCPSCPKGCQ